MVVDATPAKRLVTLQAGSRVSMRHALRGHARGPLRLPRQAGHAERTRDGRRQDRAHRRLDHLRVDELKARTAPNLPFLVDSTALGDNCWEKSQATISGHKVCADKSCRGFDGYHVDGCDCKAIVSKAKINKNMGILKGFQRVIKNDPKPGARHCAQDGGAHVRRLPLHELQP